MQGEVILKVETIYAEEGHEKWGVGGGIADYVLLISYSLHFWEGGGGGSEGMTPPPLPLPKKFSLDLRQLLVRSEAIELLNSCFVDIHR